MLVGLSIIPLLESARSSNSFATYHIAQERQLATDNVHTASISVLGLTPTTVQAIPSHNEAPGEFQPFLNFSNNLTQLPSFSVQTFFFRRTFQWRQLETFSVSDTVIFQWHTHSILEVSDKRMAQRSLLIKPSTLRELTTFFLERNSFPVSQNVIGLIHIYPKCFLTHPEDESNVCY